MEIKNVALCFVVKFLWTIVRHRLSLISMDNVLTLGRVVLISILINGYDIDFARWIRTKIHQRAF